MIPTPRDYQAAAVHSLFDYFSREQGNPVVALPTGTGKGFVIAWFLKQAYEMYSGTRAMMLTHVQELIEQNLEKLVEVWPTAPAGVYSAGLGRKEHKHPITLAGIQSVHRRPELFGQQHMVLIDECHLVSDKETTTYRKFLAALMQANPKLKVIGFSATPYRLGKGMLTDPGGIFTDVCFDLTSLQAFNWLLAQGWIAPLVTKRTLTELDITGVRTQAGEFVLQDLQFAVDKEATTRAALQEACHFARDRQHWLVFATGIDHTEHVAAELNALGVPAAAIHSKTTDEERATRLRDYRNGRLRALVSNNILTTGFDYAEIDCILVLRPTSSPGLWVQMLGRGTRPAPGKTNCLVMDFAGNTRRLGPINDPVLPRQRGQGAAGVAPVRLCEYCACYSHASARYCETCGHEFPRILKITAEAAVQDVIRGVADKPVITTLTVDHVVYRLHKKEGKPDSMRVDYHCGLRRFSEYICLDHTGYAHRIAVQWWRMRSPWGVPPDVHAGMKAVEAGGLRTPKAIQVLINKKHPDIAGYHFE